MTYKKIHHVEYGDLVLGDEVLVEVNPKYISVTEDNYTFRGRQIDKGTVIFTNNGNKVEVKGAIIKINSNSLKLLVTEQVHTEQDTLLHRGDTFTLDYNSIYNMEVL